ncbi:MAG: HGGxSTG domain-containing protein [Burkholderiaceae bacterium]|jgi:hypothetical protein
MLYPTYDVMCDKSNGIDSVDGELMLTTAGGRIVCRRCSAMSKRIKIQCAGPAIKGKNKCKFHGGLSVGPKSELGRQICFAAKTVHGKDTRAVRKKHRRTAMKIRLCAALLGLPWRSDAGTKRL